MSTMITVSHYDLSTSLGTARFLNVPLLVLHPTPVSAAAFDAEKHQHELPTDVKHQLEREIAKTFLADHSLAAQQRDEGLSCRQLRAVFEFLGIDERSFARLLGVSLGALKALLQETARAVSKYLSLRSLLILEAEILDAGFAQKFAAGVPAAKSGQEPSMHSEESLSDDSAGLAIAQFAAA